MTRCAEFYEKWEKVPNWCEKTKASVSHINNYLELVHAIESEDLPSEFIIDRLPEHLARPVFLRKNAWFWDRMVEIIGSALRTGKHPVTGRFFVKFTMDDITQIMKKLQAENQLIKTPANHLSSSLFCLRCGEKNYDLLVQHHVLPREIGGEKTQTVTVCVKCHSILHSILKPYVEEIKLILKEGN